MSSIKDFFKPIDRRNGLPDVVDLTSATPSNSLHNTTPSKAPSKIGSNASSKEDPKTDPKHASPAKRPRPSTSDNDDQVTDGKLPSSSLSQTETPGKKQSSYAAYLRRKAEHAGPSAPGSKPLPVGQPNCLLGLAFVFTGELTSLAREDAQDLVKRYGARVTTAPSSKTSYVVVGDGAGESKLAKVQQLGIPTLNEDQLLKLIVDSSPPRDSKVPEPAKEEMLISKASQSVDNPQRKSPRKYSPRKPALSEPVTSEVHEPLAVNASQLLVDKYAPRTASDLLGNQGIYAKLLEWLHGWYIPQATTDDMMEIGAPSQSSGP
jgi:replication factor C subunit 1